MLIQAFSRAVSQLRDPAIRRVVWLSLLISLGVFASLWSGIAILFTQTTFFSTGWLDAVADVLGGVATLLLTWIFFPAVVTLVMSFFLEHVADEVERRYYPLCAEGRAQPIDEALWGALKFLATTIALNAAAIPFLLVPVVFPFVFFAVNGYLFGREYFETAALRRIQPSEVASLRRRHRADLFLGGLVITALFTIPFVNLFAPVVGVAAMVHLYHRFAGSERA